MGTSGNVSAIMELPISPRLGGIEVVLIEVFSEKNLTTKVAEFKLYHDKMYLAMMLTGVVLYDVLNACFMQIPDN